MVNSLCGRGLEIKYIEIFVTLVCTYNLIDIISYGLNYELSRIDRMF